MPSAITPPRLLTLVLLTAASTSALNMFLPSLPKVGADLGGASTIATFAVSGYLAATAVILIVLGPLSDRLGRRPVILGAVAVFTLASVVAAMAENAATFLICRSAQGAMIAGYGISLASVRDASSGADATRRIAATG